MKIGLLTFHHVVNDGSVMQAVSLYRLLVDHFGENVEMIDYVPAEMAHHNRRQWLQISRARFDATKRSREIKQKKFLREHCKFTQQRCVTGNLDVAAGFIDAQKYDVVVVGSDTVWDLTPPRNLPGIPNAYFVPGRSKNTRRISFAASADPLDRPEILVERREELRTVLDGFDVRGVRDMATMEVLKKLGYTEDDYSFVPDPTISWGFEKLWKSPPLATDPNLAAVALSHTNTAVEAIRQLEAAGYRVDNLLSGPKSPETLCMLNTDVETRVRAYGKYAVVITDRFHGSIFSLCQGAARVAFIEDAEKWPLANSKGRDLFGRLKLGDFVFRFPENHLPNDFVGQFLAVNYPGKNQIAHSIRHLHETGQAWASRHLTGSIAKAL